MKVIAFFVLLSSCSVDSLNLHAVATPIGRHPRLVFDIGMNRGDDTEMYLKMGFNVVAVEGNPVLCKQNEDILQKYIRNGQLVIKNRVVHNETRKSQSFYAAQLKPSSYELLGWLDRSGLAKLSFQWSESSTQNETAGLRSLFSHWTDELSSISQENACNLNAMGCLPNQPCPEKGLGDCSDNHPLCECKKVDVQSTTCEELILEHGVPHYLKIDIEGFDGHCLKKLATLPCSSLPEYISFEEQDSHMEHVSSSHELISSLSARGYVWKVSRQLFAEHARLGSGPFGEEVNDFVYGSKWRKGEDAQKQANRGCWGETSNGYFTYDCDVHGKFVSSQCVEPS